MAARTPPLRTPPADLREATLRLAELARGAGDAAQARQLLVELVARGAADADTRAPDLGARGGRGRHGGRVLRRPAIRAASPSGEAQIAAAGQLVALAEQHRQGARRRRRRSRPRWRRTRISSRLIDCSRRCTSRPASSRSWRGCCSIRRNRNPDEEQRFEQLRRAGAFAIQAQDASLAVMALNEALAVRPGDEETTLLLSDAYVLAGALEEAAALIQAAGRRPQGQGVAGAGRAARAAGPHRGARRAIAPGELAALGHALDADKKNGELAAEVADRAEEAGDDELALKALRLIVAHNAPGPISVAAAFLRQARIAQRRGETERAVMFARRASHDARQGRSRPRRGARVPRSARRPTLAPASGPEGAQVVAVTSGRSGSTRRSGQSNTGKRAPLSALRCRRPLRPSRRRRRSRRLWAAEASSSPPPCPVPAPDNRSGRSYASSSSAPRRISADMCRTAALHRC